MLVTLFHAYEQRLVAKACNRSSQSCQPQRGSPSCEMASLWDREWEREPDVENLFA